MDSIRGYQENYSTLAASVTDLRSRKRKYETMLAVLNDWSDTKAEELSEMKVLDVGASTGVIDYFLADHFCEISGIDIDKHAIELASKTYQKRNLRYEVGDAMDLKYANDDFDIIICTHVYEHVPDDERLMSEMYRVLKPGGAIYFTAGNRLAVMEPHYQLPFLSYFPQTVANKYLKILKRGDVYYEKHRTHWGLRKLVKQYSVYDYTSEIIKDPKKYSATYMLSPGSIKQKIARGMAKYLYFFLPGYVWILEKK